MFADTPPRALPQSPRYWFSADNPQRPVEWRWHRAGLAVDGRMPASRRRADYWVRRAVRFRQRLAADEVDGDELHESDPAMYAAVLLYQQRGENPGFGSGLSVANQLECRVLAGQEPPQAAALLGVPETTLEAYERLFFDVRDRLHEKAWIHAVVLGQEYSPNDRGPGAARFWSYKGGVSVAEEMLGLVDGLPTPRTCAAVPGFFEDAGVRITHRRSANTLLQINTKQDAGQMTMLANWHKIRDQSRAGSAGGAGGEAESAAGTAAVESTLRCFAFTVDGQRPPDLHDRKLDDHTLAAARTGPGGVERRGDELMRLALEPQAGQPASPFADVAYPQPERRVSRTDEASTEATPEE